MRPANGAGVGVTVSVGATVGGGGGTVSVAVASGVALAAGDGGVVSGLSSSLSATASTVAEAVAELPVGVDRASGVWVADSVGSEVALFVGKDVAVAVTYLATINVGVGRA